MKKHDKPIPHKTTGKDKTYNPTEKGAGMTAKGRAEYNKKNNGEFDYFKNTNRSILQTPYLLHKKSRLTKGIGNYLEHQGLFLQWKV